MLRTSLVLRKIAETALSSVKLAETVAQQAIVTPEGRTVHLFLGPDAEACAQAAFNSILREGQGVPLTGVIEHSRTRGWYFIT